jgi:hypothetical protein
VAGHLFVVRGDLLRLACDAWLLPTDEALHVTDGWWHDAALAERLRARGASHKWRSGPWVKAFTDGRRAVPLDAAPGPRPYLTQIGASGEGADWYVSGVVEFIDAALADGPVRWLARQRPLLALPVVGTGWGGAGHVAGAILDHLVPQLAHQAATRDVDLVLVCREAAHFAAAQATRRQLQSSGAIDLWHGLDAETRAKAELLAKDALQHHLVLFLGAGVSMGAGLPSWRKLLDELARAAGLSEADLQAFESVDLLDRAQLIAERLRRSDGAPGVGQHIRTLLERHRHHGLAHALLACLPVEETITTNYDTLFELASAGAGHEAVRVLPYAPTRNGTRWLLKMHGCVEHPEDIVLTREDYMRYVERNAALAGIVQAMLITKRMLFVGFSFSDDNFLRIVDAVRRAVRGWGNQAPEPEQLGYALMPNAHPLLRTLWEKDLPWICPAGPNAEMPEGARSVEIFLDLLTHLAASHGHLMDSRFDEVLSPPERRLRDALFQLVDGADAYRDAPEWRAVEALLTQLGLRR